jgi:hypothetical protein
VPTYTSWTPEELLGKPSPILQLPNWLTNPMRQACGIKTDILLPLAIFSERCLRVFAPNGFAHGDSAVLCHFPDYWSVSSKTKFRFLL